MRLTLNLTSFRPMKVDLEAAAAAAAWLHQVPTTLDDFYALVEQAIADGNTPLCVGVESGPATGWPFTDWVEELVLRNQGIEIGSLAVQKPTLDEVFLTPTGRTPAEESAGEEDLAA